MPTHDFDWACFSSAQSSSLTRFLKSLRTLIPLILTGSLSTLHSLRLVILYFWFFYLSVTGTQTLHCKNEHVVLLLICHPTRKNTYTQGFSVLSVHCLLDFMFMFVRRAPPISSTPAHRNQKPNWEENEIGHVRHARCMVVLLIWKAGTGRLTTPQVTAPSIMSSKLSEWMSIGAIKTLHSRLKGVCKCDFTACSDWTLRLLSLCFQMKRRYLLSKGI